MSPLFSLPRQATSSAPLRASTWAPTIDVYKRQDAGYTPNLYSYTYLLSPAKTWAQFGELEVVVKTPYYMTERPVAARRRISAFAAS